MEVEIYRDLEAISLKKIVNDRLDRLNEKGVEVISIQYSSAQFCEKAIYYSCMIIKKKIRKEIRL